MLTFRGLGQACGGGQWGEFPPVVRLTEPSDTWNEDRMGRLLSWSENRGVWHTYSSKASAIVYAHGGGYHWEIFVGDTLSWHDQAETLESAVNHVEGNFIGRSLRSDLALENVG